MLNLKMTKDQADKARESASFQPAEVLPEGSYAVKFIRGNGFHSNTSQSYTSFFTFEVVDHSEFRHKTGEFAIVRLRSDGQPVVNRQGVMFAEGQFINLWSPQVYSLPRSLTAPRLLTRRRLRSTSAS